MKICCRSNSRQTAGRTPRNDLWPNKLTLLNWKFSPKATGARSEMREHPYIFSYDFSYVFSPLFHIYFLDVFRLVLCLTFSSLLYLFNIFHKYRRNKEVILNEFFFHCYYILAVIGNLNNI